MGGTDLQLRGFWWSSVICLLDGNRLDLPVACVELPFILNLVAIWSTRMTVDRINLSQSSRNCDNSIALVSSCKRNCQARPCQAPTRTSPANNSAELLSLVYQATHPDLSRDIISPEFGHVVEAAHVKRAFVYCEDAIIVRIRYHG